MKLTLALLLAISAAPVLAAGKTEAVALGDIMEVKTLEEVIITGDARLSSARKAIVKAEDRFYDRFNALVPDPSLHVNCAIETPTGHRLSYRVCRPRYVEDATHDEAMALFRAFTDGNVIHLRSVQEIMDARAVELRGKMRELVDTDPKLRRALLERARLQEHLDVLRKEKFRNRRVVWD